MMGLLKLQKNISRSNIRIEKILLLTIKKKKGLLLTYRVTFKFNKTLNIDKTQ